MIKKSRNKNHHANCKQRALEQHETYLEVEKEHLRATCSRLEAALKEAERIVLDHTSRSVMNERSPSQRYGNFQPHVSPASYYTAPFASVQHMMPTYPRAAISPAQRSPPTASHQSISHMSYPPLWSTAANHSANQYPAPTAFHSASSRIGRDQPSATAPLIFVVKNPFSPTQLPQDHLRLFIGQSVPGQHRVILPPANLQAIPAATIYSRNGPNGPTRDVVPHRSAPTTTISMARHKNDGDDSSEAFVKDLHRSRPPSAP